MTEQRSSLAAYTLLAFALAGAVALSLALDPVIAALSDAAELSELKVVGSALWDEDGVIETGTAVLALAAGVLLLGAMVRARRAGVLTRRTHLVLPGFAALSMFVLAGEEISWGQRLLGLETPAEYAEINTQGELTLHNLDLVLSPIWIMKGAALAWGVGLPLACWLLRPVARLTWLVRLPVPPLASVPFFVVAFAFPFAFKESYGNFAREGSEFLLGVSFVAVALVAWLRPHRVWVET